MAEKYCKCGHNRKDHQKHPEKKISFTGFCRKCQCNEWMNRKLPNLASKICFIIGIIIFGSFTALTIMILIAVNSAKDTMEWTKPVQDVTVGQYLTILSLFLVICNVLLWNVSGSLLSFVNERKRKEFPLEGDMA